MRDCMLRKHEKCDCSAPQSPRRIVEQLRSMWPVHWLRAGKSCCHTCHTPQTREHRRRRHIRGGSHQTLTEKGCYRHFGRARVIPIEIAVEVQGTGQQEEGPG